MNSLNALIVADVGIRRDADGRYFLNDLHRAAGGKQKDQPYEFLRLVSTVDLIAELKKPDPRREIPGADRINHLAPVRTVNSFTEEQGTFVVRELVYAYAMWISVEFNLRVIRAFDAMVTGGPVPGDPQFQVPRTMAEALRLAADLADANEGLTRTVQVLAPQAAALQRLETAQGSLCVTDAAKTLKLRPKKLFDWLAEHGWIYRRGNNTAWVGSQERVDQGWLEHKAVTVSTSDGAKLAEQVRITAKGLARISTILGLQAKLVQGGGRRAVGERLQ
jgi:phage antirepressor YoqD-like protein